MAAGEAGAQRLGAGRRQVAAVGVAHEADEMHAVGVTAGERKRAARGVEMAVLDAEQRGGLVGLRVIPADDEIKPVDASRPLSRASRAAGGFAFDIIGRDGAHASNGRNPAAARTVTSHPASGGRASR